MMTVTHFGEGQHLYFSYRELFFYIVCSILLSYTLPLYLVSKSQVRIWYPLPVNVMFFTNYTANIKA